MSSSNTWRDRSIGCGLRSGGIVQAVRFEFVAPIWVNTKDGIVDGVFVSMRSRARRSRG